MRIAPYLSCAALLAISIAYTAAANVWFERRAEAERALPAPPPGVPSTDFEAENAKVHRVFLVSEILAWLVVAHAAFNVGFALWAAATRRAWHLLAALVFGALALVGAIALGSAVGGGMIG